MGMYDTFVTSSAFICPDCGTEINSIQTKEFDKSLDIYHPGDIIRGRGIRNGIVSETLFCDKCRGPKNDDDKLIYILIWNSIFVDLFKTEAEAEEKLKSTDRLSLIEWLDKAQTERDLWHRRFNNLYSEISSLNDYEKSGDKKASLSKKIILPHIEEILNNDDPLDAILKNNAVHERNTLNGIFGI